jgi:hypothetical protein
MLVALDYSKISYLHSRVYKSVDCRKYDLLTLGETIEGSLSTTLTYTISKLSPLSFLV